MKILKSVTVYDEDIEYKAPESPKEFMAFFQNKIDLVPDESIDSAFIKLEAGSSYGCSELSLTVGYSRLETDEEERIREASLQAQSEFRKKKELRLLSELKEKYES